MERVLAFERYEVTKRINGGIGSLFEHKTKTRDSRCVPLSLGSHQNKLAHIQLGCRTYVYVRMIRNFFTHSLMHLAPIKTSRLHDVISLKIFGILRPRMKKNDGERIERISSFLAVDSSSATTQRTGSWGVGSADFSLSNSLKVSDIYCVKAFNWVLASIVVRRVRREHKEHF